MVLPLFNVPAFSDLPTVGSELTLGGSEGKHAVTVRRMRVGEGIQVADGLGNRVTGVVAELRANELTIRVDEALHEPALEPRFTLVQALAKGDRDELAIQAATELGIESVIPWQADRSVSRWEGAKVAKGVERWQVIVGEAAKQALRSRTPRVEAPVTTKQLVNQISELGCVLVLDPTATHRISSVSLPPEGHITLVVGPEGGISESELAILEQAGAIRVRLGAEILRTSTAGMAAIAVLLSRLNRW
jgi:16S rRNA (uracil1498-N3)-methyltransferase